MPESKTIKRIEGQLHRNATVERSIVDIEKRTVEVAFSSEEPYLRWFGYEILDHSKKSCDLSRLNNGGAVLVDHNTREQVGVIEKAWIGDDRVGRALVRFGKSARAEQEMQDVADGIRRHLSVGYQILEMELEKQSKGEPDMYRATNWQPFEISFVSVPADTTVGVGREAIPKDITVIYQIESEEKTMAANPTIPQATAIPAVPAAPAVPGQPDMRTLESQVRGQELARINEINAIAEKFGLQDFAKQAVATGMSVEDFRKNTLDELGKPKIVQMKGNEAEIGMSPKEAKRYSILNMVRARLLQAEGQPNAFKGCDFELECHNEILKRMGDNATPKGFLVPLDVLKVERDFRSLSQSHPHLLRDLTVGTATAGGHTVATNLLASNFIDLLRNAMVIYGMGAQMLTGLVGNIAIPRQTGGATAYWLAESGSPTEAQQAFDQVAMSPKTIGAYTDISRLLLKQSSVDVETLVMLDLAKVIALAIQSGAIKGSGSSNEPTGIINVAGIGSVAGGTNGAAPTYAHMVDLETEVAQDDADVGTLGYLTNTKVRGTLKKTLEFAAANSERVWKNGTVNDYKATVTNAIPSNLTKGSASGVCSGVIFGNWADLIIGMWGGLDVLVDPYTGGTSGTVRIVNHQSVDVAVRHAQSFSAMLDALT